MENYNGNEYECSEDSFNLNLTRVLPSKLLSENVSHVDSDITDNKKATIIDFGHDYGDDSDQLHTPLDGVDDK